VVTLHRPGSVDEACRLLTTLTEPLAYGGGTAIQILVRQGVLFPSDLVDLAGIPRLTELTVDGRALRAGAMVTLRRIERDPRVRANASLVATACGRVANPRVRNTASIGGSLAHGDYRMDPPTALLALDAVVEVTSVDGSRRIPAREFFVDLLTTALRPGELVTAVEIPVQPWSAGVAFVKLTSLGENDWPSASVAAVVRPAGGPRRRVRLGIGALAPTPRLVEVPAVRSADEAVEAAVAAAEPVLAPIPDLRGGVTYKRRLARVAVRDAVRQAWREASDDG
jgi:carbon-monoxide dehydrogenase medium subunit